MGERTESTIEWRDGEFRRGGQPLRTYDPTRERVVPLDASPSDVVVLGRKDAEDMLDLAKLAEKVAQDQGALKAWATNRRLVARLRSAIDREHAE